MRMRAGSFCRCSLNMLLYILHLLDVLMLWSPSKKRWRTLHILHSWKLSSATKQENVNVIIIASFRSCSDTFGKQLFSLLIWLHACECLLSKSSFVLCNIFHFIYRTHCQDTQFSVGISAVSWPTSDMWQSQAVIYTHYPLLSFFYSILSQPFSFPSCSSAWSR